ncbi:hypothetical protein SLEP1_g49196 [Rubroshorea leprosula]|uniref:Methyltransferase type 11 domain-containing protein n=1 Tax=Rubroshorea leprosula TaxID=152421 RepID=A0AAV5LZA7_9ROSI|nr:hypothetical protein SLEP1_g49196 [Rubroshorea leprosula]
MANLFINQAKQYAVGRPSYPKQLFQYFASKTPSHDLVWDVGTGTGQAARSLAELYKNVIATDTSPTQLEHAPKLPNIRYQHTSPIISMEELQQNVVATESSVDLVTVAQAMHWFDLPKFYEQVRWVLKKPNGVIAAWCYSLPEINEAVDAVLLRFYNNSYWDPQRKLVDEKYTTIDFPFEPVEGESDTGPFDQFAIERVMNFDEYITYLRSWSAYQKAKEKGIDLLGADVIENFRRAWNVDGDGQKLAKYPIYLRIGRVGKQ